MYIWLIYVVNSMCLVFGWSKFLFIKENISKEWRWYREHSSGYIVENRFSCAVIYKFLKCSYFPLDYIWHIHLQTERDKHIKWTTGDINWT